MAYAALIALAQTTDLILNCDDKYSLSVDEKETIKSIREYVFFFISFLDGFPEKANVRLEGKIRYVANETEVIIEYFMWKQNQVSWWNIGLSRVEFEKQLKKIAEEIGHIAGEMMDVRLGDLPAAAISSSRLAPAGKDDKVIGLDDDLMAIKCRLYRESPKLQVIPIVGMGGIGKTTLARYVYDGPLVREYFDIRAWVTISQSSGGREILSGILDSMKMLDGKNSAEKKLLDEMKSAEEVYKSLKGRRYLIVMDDVWSTDAWDDVRNVFPDDDNGSRIMITTRLSDVAAYADSCSPLHEMRFMDGNQSWNLLKQKVFTYGEDCPPELEDIGKEIAQNCKGLPLAVVLIAGILSTVVKTRASWEKIGKNVNSAANGQLEEVLSLSYTHLPHHLRPCFLFFAVFPEDFGIHVSRLIKLWVAEGFLKCQNRYKCLEEEAEGYLEDLVKRRLVLVTSRKSNGKIKSCSLHDLVREMCIRIAQDEKFLLNVVDGSVKRSLVKSCSFRDRVREFCMRKAQHKKFLAESIKNKRRRISISTSHLDDLANFWGSTVHTIVCFRLRFRDRLSPLAFVGNFRLLRVLDVVNKCSELLPSQLFELFHLRYLALGVPEKIPSGIARIPSGISNLVNLQTLILNPRYPCPNHSHLPLEIWRMPQLRHLLFPYCYVLPDPAADGSLTLPLENLQTLLGVTNLVCSERIMKMIPNLKKLGIIYIRDQDCCLQNLINLHQLEKLKLIVDESSFWRWQRQNPAFPRTLKKLTLESGRLPWKDMTIIGSLPALEVLKLRDSACDGDTWETTDGEFCQLKFLQIVRSDLQHWITEACHFPRLERLVLRYCKSLSEIPDGIGEIPTLQRIEVDDQNKSLVDSAKQIQEDQQSDGNDAFVVSILPSLILPSNHWRMATKAAASSGDRTEKRGLYGNGWMAGGQEACKGVERSHYTHTQRLEMVMKN